jgi:3-hydroxypropanoate dehydrogenase
MIKPLSEEALDQLFRRARSHNGWIDKPIDDDLLMKIYDLMKMGPTSVNSSPARLFFLRSERAKQRLLSSISPGNVDKVMTAPVVTLIAYDTNFHEHLPQLFPHNPGVGSVFSNNSELRESTAFRNSSLQGAYFMLAARSLGLDCGPISGFDASLINREFFANEKLKVNFLCNLGFGDYSKIFPRGPRLNFEQACSLL